ncbi:hypothetical protein BVD23_19985 [Salmonella enterica]|nr:hypothetical protein [Salmonella enterica]
MQCMEHESDIDRVQSITIPWTNIIMNLIIIQIKNCIFQKTNMILENTNETIKIYAFLSHSI